MRLDPNVLATVQNAVNPDRLVETAVRLIEVPSPTLQAGQVADRLAELVKADGFSIERPVADWPEAPAVAARLEGRQPGRTLQFDGHLDTVHLPFVPPRVQEGVLTGSGASDMKGGLAAAVEAMRALHDCAAIQRGSVLLTAHDHHEAPWGDCRQLYALVREGIVGDGVLLPEYLCDRLPVVGRGLAVLEICVRRDGEPVHEVFRSSERPDVISAGCELIQRLHQWNTRLSTRSHPLAGAGSVFVGKIEAGQIYNQSPNEFHVYGTRRWLPDEPASEVANQYRGLLKEVARETGTTIDSEFEVRRDAFTLDEGDPLIEAFQEAHHAVSGRRLPLGAKPFVDDGNALVARAGVAAITHGPAARGAHTVNEVVPVDELVRVARTYALTALAFC